MNITEKFSDELFKDKSLWDVYMHSKSYAETKFDKHCKWIASITLLLLSAVLFFSKPEQINVAAQSIKAWLDMGFVYSITILGFLVAGFTIFATMTKVEIFASLTVVDHKAENISHVKFIFYNFLVVFINHIVLLSASVIITMFKNMNSVYLSGFSSDHVMAIKKFCVIVLFPIIGFLLINAILQLKTFVWNLYQAVIIAIAGAISLYEQDREKKKSTHSA